MKKLFYFCFMKKLFYFCLMMLLNVNMMAQIDVNDGTWKRVFNDNFVGNSWDAARWYVKDNNGDILWRAYLNEALPSGIVKPYKVSVYQKSPIKFAGTLPNDTVLRIVDTLASTTALICPYDYDLPPDHYCDNLNDIPDLFYYSGNLETLEKFRFGYFETRCKLPIHIGSAAAFWLFGNSATTYEEIDIFEYCKGCYDDDPTRGFSCGIWYNPNAVSYPDYPLSVANAHLPITDNPVSEWHTYGCEWLPDRITWYCDGNIINECNDVNHIPRKAGKTMKLNYAIDTNAVVHDSILWQGGGVMSIDYARIYQLEWDCDTDVTITSDNDLAAFDHKVKHSVTICPTSRNVTVHANDTVTFRVNDSFSVTGPFVAESGGNFTVIRQACPEE